MRCIRLISRVFLVPNSLLMNPLFMVAAGAVANAGF